MLHEVGHAPVDRVSRYKRHRNVINVTIFLALLALVSVAAVYIFDQDEDDIVVITDPPLATTSYAPTTPQKRSGYA